MEGFTVFPVQMYKSNAVVRHLFIKEHKAKEKVWKKPAKRTLLVLNVPPLVEEEALKNCFKAFGEVNKVVFQQEIGDLVVKKMNPNKFFDVKEAVDTYRVAYVVFKTEKGLEAVLKEPITEPQVICIALTKIDRIGGIERWQKEYNESIINTAELQSDIDTFMTQYDEEVELERKREKAMENAVDEEGWTKVTSHGKRKFNPNTEMADQRIMANIEKRNKPSPSGMPDFYSFSKREDKKSRKKELLKKFDEDKKKIALRKANRKFNPL